MFGMPIVEVAIGLCFVYLLLALICSTINETIAGITGRRANLLKKVGKTGLQQSLATVLADGRRNLASDQEKIEAWYNECMDRVSGWYKRHTQIWIWILAACVTLALDADTVQIFKVLWKNQGVRSA